MEEFLTYENNEWSLIKQSNKNLSESFTNVLRTVTYYGTVDKVVSFVNFLKSKNYYLQANLKEDIRVDNNLLTPSNIRSIEVKLKEV